MTPAELRAAALTTQEESAALAEVNPADPVAAALLATADAARRLADVIEYADRHAAFPPRGPLQGAVAWENIRRIARGETGA